MDFANRLTRLRQLQTFLDRIANTGDVRGAVAEYGLDRHHGRAWSIALRDHVEDFTRAQARSIEGGRARTDRGEAVKLPRIEYQCPCCGRWLARGATKPGDPLPRIRQQWCTRCQAYRRDSECNARSIPQD